jgi:hypothetical protein
MSLIARRWRALVAGAAALAALPVLAQAQVPGEVAPMRPIRMTGYWDRGRSAPGVLEGVGISTDGGTPRTFGITALQAYKPEEEGPQVLRHSGLQPSLRLLGPADMVRRLMSAPSTERIVLYGVYRPGTGTIAVGSVQVGSEPASAAR